MEDLRKRLGRPVVKDMAKVMLASAHVAAKHVAAEAPRDTSQLARSFLANVGFVERSDETVTTRTHSPLPYARIQDQGGTIKPKTAKMLAIPFTAKARARWPRDWARDKLALIEVRGKKFLIERVGEKAIFHYILKESVTLEGKQYIAKAKRKAAPEIDRLVRTRIAELMKGKV